MDRRVLSAIRTRDVSNPEDSVTAEETYRVLSGGVFSATISRKLLMRSIVWAYRVG